MTTLNPKPQTAESAADRLHGRSRLRPRPPAERLDRTVREGKASRYTGTEMIRLRLAQYGRQSVIMRTPNPRPLRCFWSVLGGVGGYFQAGLVSQAGRLQGRGSTGPVRRKTALCLPCLPCLAGGVALPCPGLPWPALPCPALPTPALQN